MYEYNHPGCTPPHYATTSGVDLLLDTTASAPALTPLRLGVGGGGSGQKLEKFDACIVTEVARALGYINLTKTSATSALPYSVFGRCGCGCRNRIVLYASN